MRHTGLSDYHLHTPLCRHAEGWPIDFARRAAELGFEEIGFADHSPMPSAFDDWRMLREELPRYLASVEEARAATPHLSIRLGLEVDYLANGEAWWEELRTLAPWDFWIGSVHYLPDGMEVDNPKYLNRYREMDPELVWTSYWRTYESCIRSGWFHFVGHPDLPKKFGFRPSGDLKRFYEPAIQALVDTGIAYEVNTAGLRKDCRELYPAFDFIRMAREAGVPVLVNSDAHAPGELGAGFEEALRCVREAGYSEVVRFRGGERYAVSLSPHP
jgi:histidinol-phosphatase (PHP family)